MSHERCGTTPSAPNQWTPGFETPQRLLARTDLTRQRKIEIVQQWEPDVRARMVAEDENMRATEPVPVTLDEVLVARLSRDRERDAFCARDAAGRRIAAGPLEQVFADLDAYFVSLHGELPDPAA